MLTPGTPGGQTPARRWATPAELLQRRVERMRHREEPTAVIREFLNSHQARRRYGDHNCDHMADLVRRRKA